MKSIKRTISTFTYVYFNDMIAIIIASALFAIGMWEHGWLIRATIGFMFGLVYPTSQESIVDFAMNSYLF